ncbi:MAG: hypothetical protein COB36_10585 [Alphaproteobacteria bacterium]|nr:MAG: hypothetical protein COB36_10585 [Alphaproteobacteria bacterium]
MQPPFKKVNFPPVELKLSTGEGAVIYLESALPVPDYEPNLAKILMAKAVQQPDRTFLAMRNNHDGWDRITYGASRDQMLAIAQWLLNQNIGQDRSILLLSGNSIEHAMITLGALVAGVPVCPVSSNYSLLKIFSRLDYVADLVKPAVIFADDGAAYGPALDHLAGGDIRIVTRATPAGQENSFSYDEVIATVVTPETRRSIEDLDPDAPHKYMLTSGSTGLPKAVIHTSRMQAANAAFCSSVMAGATSWAAETLDWLPWSHVSGALVQSCVMLNGGTLYIDDGKPIPGHFGKSLRNIRELKVTFLTNIPLAYELLANELERDAGFRAEFFSNVQHLVYGGAGISADLYRRYQKMSVAETGKRLLFGAGYGATETASGVLATYFEIEGPGVGLPQPGILLKLVPVYNGFELRVAGDTLTPGYYKRPDLNETLLDEEGYYAMGDVVDWVEPGVPERGLKFIGRLSDEFKLASGTWVNAYDLKEKLRPEIGALVADFVLCGVNRASSAILAWPNLAACRAVVGGSDLPDGEILAHPKVRANIQAALSRHNQANPTGSFRISAFKFLMVPPDLTRGEVTDKGTINAVAVLANRPDDVQSLYSRPEDDGVIQSP